MHDESIHFMSLRDVARLIEARAQLDFLVLKHDHSWQARHS
jgi:hypothetical protein